MLTPLLVVAAILAHVLSDSAVVVVLPLGAALFFVAGRHPLLGIVATLAPLMGVLFANLVPISLDAILAGFTESGARVLAPAYQVTPLNNSGSRSRRPSLRCPPRGGWWIGSWNRAWPVWPSTATRP